MSKFPDAITRTRWLWRTATLGVAAAAAFAAYACSDRSTQTAAPTGPTPTRPSFNITGYGGAAGFTFDINGAQWTSGFDVTTSVGTGVIRPFLDMQDSPIENGFNTDNDAFVYDQHRTSATNALPLNYVPVFSGPVGYGKVREFVLDAHESDSFFNIDEFQVYLCFTDAARTYSLLSQVTAACEPVYDIASASPAPPINATDQFSSGSGNVFDYRILIPDTKFQAAATNHGAGTQLCEYDPSAAGEAACHQYIIVWSSMSDVGSTYEEFSTILRPAVRITKTPDAGTVDAGNDITFTMVVTSSGGTSSAVTLSDPLPTGVTWYTSTTTAGSCNITGASPQTLNCDLGDIAAGATVTVTVSAHTTQSSCAVYNNTGTVTSTDGGEDSDNGSITVQNCHGTLIIKKVSVGGTGTFDFTSASAALPSPAVGGAFSLTTVTAGTAVQQSFTVLAGTAYGVSETGQTGWTFTGRACVVTDAGAGGSSIPADGTTQPASITVGAGATVTCTYTNTKQAILRIAKSTDPDGDPTDFTFTPTNWNGGTTFTRHDNQAAFSSGFLAPGATNYDAVETVPAGWALASTACVLTGTATAKSFAAISNGVRVNLNAGEDVTCTFSDTKQAVLRIAKATDPDADPTDFTFTPTNWNSGATFTRHDNQAAFASEPLAPGATNYDAVETVPAGWALTARACVLTGTATAKSFTSISNGVRVNLSAGEDVTCTFTDTKQAILRIAKATDPDADPTDFTFTPTNWNSGTTFTRHDNQAAFASDFLVPGATNYDAVETVPAGWDLTGRACVLTGTATAKSFTSITNGVRVNLSAGQDVTCTFSDRKRATVTVNKTESGVTPLAHTWTFEIRSGATTLSAGTVEATGTADQTTGAVTFVCSPEDANCTNVSGVANLVPGDYQLCETGMPAGFHNNISSPPGFTPAGAQPEGADNSTECVPITLAAGASGVPTGIPNPIDNTPPPGGDARTIGYWKNWSSCTGGKQYLKATAPGGVGILFTLDGYLPSSPAVFPLGDITSMNCTQAVRILDKRDIVTGTKMAGDAAYGLAAQLLAAKLNVAAGAGTCQAALDAIANGQALLADDPINFLGTGSYLGKVSGATLTTIKNNALLYASQLDAYNNNTLCP